MSVFRIKAGFVWEWRILKILSKYAKCARLRKFGTSILWNTRTILKDSGAVASVPGEWKKIMKVPDIAKPFYEMLLCENADG